MEKQACGEATSRCETEREAAPLTSGLGSSLGGALVDRAASGVQRTCVLTGTVPSWVTLGKLLPVSESHFPLCLSLKSGT